MSDLKASGEFLLKHFDTFNEAVHFFEKTLNPHIEKGIDHCTAAFAKAHAWEGEFQLHDDNCIWLRPAHWKTDTIDARFKLDCTNSEENDDYWVTLFFNQSLSNDVAGLFFCVDTKLFGGKRAWDACIKNISPSQHEQLIRLGFRQSQGHFFLPIRLSHLECAKSWLAEDPYTPDDECFAPLRQALEQTKSAIATFDAIMQDALALHRQ
jgi:hypothetical protein